MLDLIAVAFILVHNLDGDEVAINIDQITSLTRPSDNEGRKMLTDHVNCVIGMANGKFHSVEEECSSILRRIMEERR